MPYIDQKRRDELDPFIDGLIRGPLYSLFNAGDLAYILFRLMKYFWLRSPSFTHWAVLRGTVNDQVDEFRGRYVREYEDRKREQNGDICA